MTTVKKIAIRAVRSGGGQRTTPVIDRLISGSFEAALARGAHELDNGESLQTLDITSHYAHGMDAGKMVTVHDKMWGKPATGVIRGINISIEPGKTLMKIKLEIKRVKL